MSRNEKVLGKHASGGAEEIEREKEKPVKRAKVEPTPPTGKTRAKTAASVSPPLPPPPSPKAKKEAERERKEREKRERKEKEKKEKKEKKEREKEQAKSQTPEKRPKKEHLTPDELNIVLQTIAGGPPPRSTIESRVDIDSAAVGSVLPTEDLAPRARKTAAKSAPPVSAVMSPQQLLNRVMGTSEVTKKETDKKPKILKSDHLPKLQSGPKVSWKIEKLQRKYTKYTEPEEKLRGVWTVRDDYNLLDRIELGDDIASLCKNHDKYFSKPFTEKEIMDRWTGILHDTAKGEEAVAMLALHPYATRVPSLSDQEKQVVYHAKPILTKAYFASLLQENRAIFHSSRTSQYLLETYKHMLLNEDVTKFPNYLSFLKDQKDKIGKLQDKAKPTAGPTTTATSGDGDKMDVDVPAGSTTTTTTTSTTSDKQASKKQQQQQEQEQLVQDIVLRPEDILNENDMELDRFLYNIDLESAINMESMINKSKWDGILAEPILNAEVSQNDLILNPFCSIPKYMMFEKEEKNDLRSMVKIEREYELDKDRESRSLAVIRGRNIRYLMKSKDIIIGRDFSEKNIIDLDLQLERPTQINLISKKQLIIKLKSDVNFYIQNIGKNNVFVNGCPIPQNEKIHLQDLSLIEFADIRIVFEINKVFLTKVRRHINTLLTPKKNSNHGSSGGGNPSNDQSNSSQPESQNEDTFKQQEDNQLI